MLVKTRYVFAILMIRKITFHVFERKLVVFFLCKYYIRISDKRKMNSHGNSATKDRFIYSIAAYRSKMTVTVFVCVIQ